MHASRTFAAYAAAGLSGLLALAVLNLTADHFPQAGISQLRDYLVRRNG
jgi:hypothetical protein